MTLSGIPYISHGSSGSCAKLYIKLKLWIYLSSIGQATCLLANNRLISHKTLAAGEC